MAPKNATAKKKTTKIESAPEMPRSAPEAAPPATPPPSTPKMSALATLKALGAKREPEKGDGTSRFAAIDPVIQAAANVKNVVRLGFDPLFAKVVGECAKVVAVLRDSEAAFATFQSQIRDYGATKRTAYNDAFATSVVTVNVPYQAESPAGTEIRYVQVTCQNRYSIQQEPLLKNRAAFEDVFDMLFDVRQVKTLRPNAEELIRGVLEENGIVGEALDQAMEALVERREVASTKEDYEEKEKALPVETKFYLGQWVQRVQPSLKFVA